MSVSASTGLWGRLALGAWFGIQLSRVKREAYEALFSRIRKRRACRADSAANNGPPGNKTCRVQMNQRAMASECSLQAVLLVRRSRSLTASLKSTP